MEYDLSFGPAPKLNFPDDAWNWFIDACKDLDIPVNDNKKTILQNLYSHLVHVNESLNLTRITDPMGYLKFHVFDSLTVLNLIQAYTKPGEDVLDLGSGGGYPGLPLMTWLPDRKWTLVDSRPKKVEFLKQTILLTPAANNATAMAFRGREAASQAPGLYRKCKLVTARAVGKAAEILPDAAELLDIDGLLLLLKGPAYPVKERDDFLDAMPKFGFELMEEHRLVLDDDDPERWIVIAIRTNPPASERKKPKSRFKSPRKPKRQP